MNANGNFKIAGNGVKEENACDEEIEIFEKADFEQAIELTGKFPVTSFFTPNGRRRQSFRQEFARCRLINLHLVYLHSIKTKP